LLEGIPATSVMSPDQRTLVPQEETSGEEAMVERGATEVVGAEVETEVATEETEPVSPGGNDPLTTNGSRRQMSEPSWVVPARSCQAPSGRTWTDSGLASHSTQHRKTGHCSGGLGDPTHLPSIS